jgi:purine-binding chemotaxis protein CheW
MNSMVAGAARRKSDSPSGRWVGFELNRQCFGVKIEQVREVLASAMIEPVPGAPSLVLGVINLRGRIVTVLDLHRCMDMTRASDQETCVIIVDFEGEPLALRVDRIAELCSVSEAAIKPAPPTAQGGANASVSGIVSRDGALLTLLDLNLLLKAAT